MTETPTVSVESTQARSIAFLADTHIQASDGLPPEATRALAAAELIVHCGHIGTIALLDRLEEIAPTVAVVVALDEKQNADAIGNHKQRIARLARVLETPMGRIGIRFNISGQEPSDPEGPPWPLERGSVHEVLAAEFGAPVDVVVHANTHIGRIHHREGVMFVDPGSPNLPGGWRKGGLGTIAVIDDAQGWLRAEIVDLRRYSA